MTHGKEANGTARGCELRWQVRGCSLPCLQLVRAWGGGSKTARGRGGPGCRFLGLSVLVDCCVTTGVRGVCVVSPGAFSAACPEPQSQVR